MHIKHPVNTLVLKYVTDLIPNGHRCRLVWVVRVVCAQPGTVVCSRHCCRLSERGGVGLGLGGVWGGWFVYSFLHQKKIILSINVNR